MLEMEPYAARRGTRNPSEAAAGRPDRILNCRPKRIPTAVPEQVVRSYSVIVSQGSVLEEWERKSGLSTQAPPQRRLGRGTRF